MRPKAMALALAMGLAAPASTTLALAPQGNPCPPTASPWASWQLPDQALGARVAPILLLSRPDVRAELQSAFSALHRTDD